MSIIVKSGSSGNLLNVNADGTLPVSIENTPSVAALDKMVTGVISNPDIVVPAPGGLGQMVSGTSTTGSFLAIPTTGLSSWSLSVTGGTFSTTFYFEGSIDTTNGLDGNWVSLFGRLLGNSGNENSQSFTLGNQMFEGTCGPLQFMRLRSVGGTITDPPTVILQAGAVSTISIGTPLPTGNNVIGHVVVDSGSLSAVVVTQSIGSNLHVDVDNFPATQPVSISGTVPVSGAVTANVGSTGGLALDATLTGGTQKTKLVDAAGVNVASVDAAGDVQVDVNNFPATQAVTGTFFQATQPVSAASWPLPTNAAIETGGNLATLVSQTSTIAQNTANETSGAAKSQVTDPITFTGASVSAKGVQGANSLAVQQPKDSGRSKTVLTLTKVTSITTEALVTLTQKKGDAATTTGTSYTVTAGKTLRIQAILLSATLTVAGITAVAIRLREGAAGGGAVSTASDIIAEVEVSANTATIGVSGQQIFNFPDGLEITGGQILGVSELATTVDAAVTLCIVGYEY